MLRALAPAKINLALHVTGRRDDGYHLLDSLVVFADTGDVVEARTAPALVLSITGPQSQGVPVGPDNLILRAARMMRAENVALTLHKHLPMAAGLGGGSSDAAATLRCIAELTGAPLPGPQQLLQLGADVPTCVAARPCRMQGIGERISDLPPLPPMWLVLVNPGVQVSTAAVFSAMDSRENPPLGALPGAWEDAADFCRWLAQTRNDLEASARRIAPEIDTVVHALAGTQGCLLARMSGSGASCFGLFASAARAETAARTLAARAPHWWVAASGLLSPDAVMPATVAP